MWTFFGEILKLIRQKRWGVILSVMAFSGTVGLAWAGKSYVDTKHQEGMLVVERLKDSNKDLESTQNQVVTTLQVMQGTLKNMESNLKQMQDTMKRVDESNRKMSDTVVDIYRDVYQIKLKQKAGG